MSGFPWTTEQLAILRRLYPHKPTRDVAKACRHSIASCYRHARRSGLKKTAEFLASPAAGIMIKGTQRGAAFRFPKGHVPANKGLRRPGWARGRMRETQFKKGQRPPNKMEIGDLRIDSEGFVAIKTSEAKGGDAWEFFHRWLWAQKHGPIPPGHVLKFRDGNRLNIDFANLELITQAENCLRNSIHHLPAPLVETIYALGRLNGRIRREKQDRRPAQSSIRNA